MRQAPYNKTMKKLFYIIYICVILYASGLSYLDYYNQAFFTLEENAVPVRIEKPITVSNSEFIEQLNQSAEQTNSVITYELLEDRGEYADVKFYTTDGKLYSQPEDLADTKPRHKFSMLYNIVVYEFHQIGQYNLGACIYYVKSPEIGRFYEELEQQGLYYEILDEDVHVKKYFTWNNMALPVLLLLACFVFMAASYRKTFVIKRIMGYSIGNIVFDFLAAVLLKMLFATMAVMGFVCIVSCFI